MKFGWEKRSMDTVILKAKQRNFLLQGLSYLLKLGYACSRRVMFQIMETFWDHKTNSFFNLLDSYFLLSVQPSSASTNSWIPKIILNPWKVQVKSFGTETARFMDTVGSDFTS